MSEPEKFQLITLTLSNGEKIIIPTEVFWNEDAGLTITGVSISAPQLVSDVEKLKLSAEAENEGD